MTVYLSVYLSFSSPYHFFLHLQLGGGYVKLYIINKPNISCNLDFNMYHGVY